MMLLSLLQRPTAAAQRLRQQVMVLVTAEKSSMANVVKQTLPTVPWWPKW